MTETKIKFENDVVMPNEAVLPSLPPWIARTDSTSYVIFFTQKYPK